MKILILSHTYYGGVYKVGSHHLFDNFQIKNHDTLYVSTPLSLLHIIKLYDVSVRARFKILLSNVFFKKNKQIIPLTIFPVSSHVFYNGIFGFFKEKVFFTDQIIENYFDLTLIDQPILGFMIAQKTSKKIIYRPTDIYEQMGQNKQVVSSCERKILSRSQGVITTSQGVLDFLISKYSTVLNEKITLVVENGVDINHFQTKTELPVEYEKTDKYKVVYVGALDERFAINDVLYAAKNLPCCHFFLIGNGSVYKQYKNSRLNNITFLGARKYENVPAYLQHADCTLLPMKSLPVNESRSPMKYYEYLAVGKPFICSWNRYLAARKSCGVLFYKDEQKLVQQLEKQIKKEVVGNGLVEIKEMDWSSKTEEILGFSRRILQE